MASPWSARLSSGWTRTPRNRSTCFSTSPSANASSPCSSTCSRRIPAPSCTRPFARKGASPSRAGGTTPTTPTARWCSTPPASAGADVPPFLRRLPPAAALLRAAGERAGPLACVHLPGDEPAGQPRRGDALRPGTGRRRGLIHPVTRSFEQVTRSGARVARSGKGRLDSSVTPRQEARRRILFICGSLNQTTQLHQVARELPELDHAFTPCYGDGLLEVLRLA